MYSWVFLCEFINLIVFFGCYCVTPWHSLFTIQSKSSTEKLLVVQTLSTQRQFVAETPIKSQIFLTRGKLLSSLHCSKCLKAKWTHICCWKWVFSHAMPKIHSFSRHCDFKSVHGIGLRSNFLWPRYNMFWRNHLLLLTGFLQWQFRHQAG